MHHNARLQFVITDGFVARFSSDASAWFKKLPQKSLGYIQAYQHDFPDDPRGDALMGAWHLEIIRKAGEGKADKWFGAKSAYGKAFYEKAIGQPPQDPVIAVNYAFALIALSVDGAPEQETLEQNSAQQENLSRARTLLENMLTLNDAGYISRRLVEKAEKALGFYEDMTLLSRYIDAYLNGEPT
eukprot:GHVR01112439.1.p2 GENE.GHVR01112439.1~~GHVR01112439.1.p2  ORF type:complete len:185 (+),score=15.17 GHVR01112439.1:1-555(+)